MKAGAIVVNQCPLIKGVNDMPGVLGEMYQILERIGVPPYYLFQGRPTEGNEPYEVPLVKGYEILKKLDVFLRAWGGERGSACPTIPAKSKSAGSMKSLSTPVTNKPKTLKMSLGFRSITGTIKLPG